MKALSFAFNILIFVVSLHVLGCSQNPTAVEKFGAPSANASDNNENNTDDGTTPPPSSPPQISPAPAKPVITINPINPVVSMFPPTEEDILEQAHYTYAQELGVPTSKVRNAWNNVMQDVLPSQVTQNKVSINHFFQFVIQVDNTLKPYFNFAAQYNDEAHYYFAEGYCSASHDKLVKFHSRLGQVEGQTLGMQNRLAHVSQIYGIGLQKVMSPSETKAKNPAFIGKVINYVSQVSDDVLLKEVLIEDLEDLLRSVSLKYGPQNNKSYISFLTLYFKKSEDDLFICPDGCEQTKLVKYEARDVKDVRIVADAFGCL